MEENNETIILKKDTITRLIKDVKEIIKHPLTSHGIYYKHHEEDILKGYALIIGPPDTPYENGYYLFKLTYPLNYPHSPPKVKYFTNDGSTRFNPNLYKCGKVCLSILNTWRGDQWSACQTISSVLLALCTIFNDKPLLNEPGILECHPDFELYNKLIQYKNYEIAILHILKMIVLDIDDASIPANKDNTINQFRLFKDIIQTHFYENCEKIVAKIQSLPKTTKILIVDLYHMTIYPDYKKLVLKFKDSYLALSLQMNK
jgi:ubiquitin-protein ligase